MAGFVKAYMLSYLSERLYKRRYTNMKRKITALLMVSVFAFSAFTACGKKDTAETTTEEVVVGDGATDVIEEEDLATSNVASFEGTETQDRAGNTIIIPDEVNAIISMAPSTTRFLIDLGLADKIVAIDTNSLAYADELPADVKEFDMMAPDNEALIALSPDIIFTSGMSNAGGEDVYQSARDAGICVADIPSSTSFDEISKDLEFIGMAVKEEDKAQTIIDAYEEQIAKVQEVGETITEKKKVLFMISIPTEEYPSIYTFGKGTYLDEMITSVGAENVTGDQESWISISEEEAIAMNPDVIITNVNYIDDVENVIKSAEGWENVAAIQNDAVYYIDSDSSNQPNNHVVDAMIQMAKLIYPDQFADFDDPFASATDAE